MARLGELSSVSPTSYSCRGRVHVCVCMTSLLDTKLVNAHPCLFLCRSHSSEYLDPRLDHGCGACSVQRSK